MATITGYTKDAIDSFNADDVTNGAIDPTSGEATLHTRGGTTIDIGSVVTPVLAKVYPVGSIYMSVNSANPGTLFGGTWVAWGTGRVPVAVDAGQTEFNSVEKTGGEKTHTLTQAEMPAHTHTGAAHSHAMPHTHTISFSFQAEATDVNTGSRPVVRDLSNQTGGGGTTYTESQTSTQPSTPNTSSATPGAGGSTGGDGAHNNLQPYITCYMWKRTA